MKKKYVKPTIEVVEMEMAQLLAASTIDLPLSSSTSENDMIGDDDFL